MSGWDWFIVAAVPFLNGLVVGWATARYAEWQFWRSYERGRRR